ncbi:MAG TPA: hypothetical protein PKN41_06310, partial [Bacteroidales bacterium]|nr:hypothetical protein [Bacteroidales bacterium]
VAFYLLAAAIMVFNCNLYNIIAVCTFLLLRVISQLFIYKKAMNKLRERKFLLYLPFFEVFFIIFNLLVMVSNTGKQQSKWK